MHALYFVFCWLSFELKMTWILTCAVKICKLGLCCHLNYQAFLEKNWDKLHTAHKRKGLYNGKKVKTYLVHCSDLLAIHNSNIPQHIHEICPRIKAQTYPDQDMRRYAVLYTQVAMISSLCSWTDIPYAGFPLISLIADAFAASWTYPAKKEISCP